jgi:hypothetical protein
LDSHPRAADGSDDRSGAPEKGQRNDGLVNHPTAPRAGWTEEFRRMAERGDDTLLDAPTPTAWDEDEWEWQ